jgi:hypothetical protein
MRDKNLEQQINVKFYVRIGEMLSLLTVAYGEYNMKKLNVCEWHRQLKEGQDDPRRGQPKMQRTDANVGRVLFGSADNVMGIYSEEETTLAYQLDSPP